MYGQIFVFEGVQLAAAERGLATQHLDQLLPLAALPVDALERDQRRQVIAVQVERLAVVRGGLLGTT
jgi:hypothetical protein